ncbi:MAG: HEAT repeat domain-containing protein [Planctomycetales bacterium]
MHSCHSLKLAALLSVALGALAASRADDPETKETQAAPVAEAEELVWHKSLEAALEEARSREGSILVRVGADWCGWCRRLERELAHPEVQQELKGWILVSLDADEDADDVQRLRVGPIPALRILNAAGRTVRTHDGYLPARQLMRWLQGEAEEEGDAQTEPVEELTKIPLLSEVGLPRLVGLLAHREASVREAVVRRLATDRKLAAPSVVEAFDAGGLATRLAALDVLAEWRAPIAQLDPWQPATLTTERLGQLRQWAEQLEADAEPLPAVEPLTPAETSTLRTELDRLLAAPAADLDAIAAPLVRFRGRALPDIRERRQQVSTDQERERLDWLRLRLLASDELALKWPGGLKRLAATEAKTRRAAADELSRTVSAGEEPLLVELLGEPDPLVRESSLKALHGLGGEVATRELLRLLNDPEPNVRGAVLKQLVENPQPKLIPRIVEYVARESDTDLLVHAVRLLNAYRGATATKCLIGLLRHESWQVRAEAAESLSRIADPRQSSSSERSVEVFDALVERLQDTDGFVISRVLAALRKMDVSQIIDPLADAAGTHPEMAHEILPILTQSGRNPKRVAKRLREFCGHPEARVRAAAITGLAALHDKDLEGLLAAGLADQDPQVRRAAATAVFMALGANPADDDEDAPGGPGGPIRFVPVDIQEGEPEAEADDNPASPDATSEPADLDAVEAKWRAAREKRLQEESWRRLVAPLESMLVSPDADEQLAAAGALGALGREDLALPTLKRLAQTQRRLFAGVAATLPWLLGDERAALLDVLAEHITSKEDLQAMAQPLSRIGTPSSEEQVWWLLSLPLIDETTAETIRASLWQSYSQGNTWDLSQLPKRQRRRVLAAVESRAVSGPYWQRITALAFLRDFEPESVVSAARALLAEGSLGPAERTDALQILLLTLPEREAVPIALEHLRAADETLLQLALHYLVHGTGRLGALREGRYHFIATSIFQRDFWGIEWTEPIEPVPPAGLAAEPLLELIESKNPLFAAHAGYLLALLQRPEGMARLMDYWRTQAPTDRDWTRLVYRAIARLDGPEHLEELRQIYAQLKPPAEERAFKEFYWTIRTMRHPDILPLRKEIRQEVGVGNLK